jgi:hypothetical protein
MAYKCRICGINEVDNQGDICELCAVGQDPYAQGQTTSQNTPRPSQSSINNSQSNNVPYVPQRSNNRKVLLNGGTSLGNQDPYGNDMTATNHQSSVQVYSAGQVPQSSQQSSNVVNTVSNTNIFGNQPITTGITKNISVDNQKKAILVKWFRALFTRIPFTLDDDVTMFQVFPDFSGTALNALGNACDQVIVYGKLNNGAVSENNDVEVYGRRDSNNNIIAKKIKNKASGTTITPARTIGQGVVWLITIIIVALVAMMILKLGIEGIIWATVIILCLTNLPRVLKIIGVIIGAIFSLIKRLF